MTRTEIVKLFPGNDPAGIEQAIVQVMDQLHFTTNDLSHEQVLAILDAMGDGLVVADETGRFVLFNAAARRLLGA